MEEQAGSVAAGALRASHETPILLYAGSCSKCRFLSRLVVALSLGRIRRVALEIPQWRRFYDEELPQAHGYPVLFENGRVVWGPRVFLMTPLVVLRSLLGARR